MQKTKIKWTEMTWNVFSGCEHVSRGCQHCYAERLAEKKRGGEAFPNGFDLTVRPYKLGEPFTLKEPSLVFVNSMSDFFLESVPDELRDQMVDVMEKTPQHKYQVLTKRPERMLAYSKRRKLPPNFWAGVTVESQDYIDRVDILRQVEVPIRFISMEPLLGPIEVDYTGISWVIVGGESGSHLKDLQFAHRGLVEEVNGQWQVRCVAADWVRQIRDDCEEADVPFFFKQWGGLQPTSNGNELDGQTWEEYPVSPA